MIQNASEQYIIIERVEYMKYTIGLLALLGSICLQISPVRAGMMNGGNEVKDWVSELEVDSGVKQMIVVSANGSRANVSMHNKDANGEWKQILETEGYVGKNGIGKTKEGEAKTPVGIFHFTDAFGIKENPGCGMPYLQVDDSYYWVDDSQSSYYNQFVTTKDVSWDWKSAEHIIGAGKVYNYVLALDYNSKCVPGLGSAIFLHCEAGKPTAGCVSVPEDIMVQIMQNVQEDCIILINSEENFQKLIDKQ